MVHMTYSNTNPVLKDKINEIPLTIEEEPKGTGEGKKIPPPLGSRQKAWCIMATRLVAIETEPSSANIS
ncbi:hypothetical protein DSO57_1006314 [Entomophthora muscae]|uniref:Uncharacterized protein n=1 Tax=Entomophthora muscae TaxID=34485 RepID=A0ACC2T7M6_9FUNG|nr:hypothetical protein DSO57_1006314 [Entomophthora muscae]